MTKIYENKVENTYKIFSIVFTFCVLITKFREPITNFREPITNFGETIAKFGEPITKLKCFSGKFKQVSKKKRFTIPRKPINGVRKIRKTVSEKSGNTT